jgi:hypothetical protein
MSDGEPSIDPCWIYDMTSEESTRWYEASQREKHKLLTRLGRKVLPKAAEHGFTWFVICDTTGLRVAKGELSGVANPGPVRNPANRNN